MSDTNLDHLTDEQNHLLMELAYQSHVLENSENRTIESILPLLPSDLGQRLTEVGLTDLVLTGVSDDRTGTGFGAISFEDPYGNVGMSFRGTDGMNFDLSDPLNSINDWTDNISTTMLGTSFQSIQALNFFNEHKDGNGKNHLYGHSKGGEISASIFVNNYLEIAGIHLLNPQPINPYKLTPDQIAMLNSDKADIVVVEGDYVWFIGLCVYTDNIRWASKISGKDSHLFSAVDYNNGTILPSKNSGLEKLKGIIVGGIVGYFQGKAAVFAFVWNMGVRVIDYIANDMWDDLASLLNSLQELGNQFVDAVNELWNEFLSCMDDLVVAVADWYNSNFNKGYIYAANNPAIVVDTNKLREYARNIDNVNNKLESLEGRIRRLYSRVGFLDLLYLIGADFMIGRNAILASTSAYLKDTATDFEDTEKVITNSL